MNKSMHDTWKQTNPLQEQINALGHELETVRQAELNYRTLAEQSPEGIIVVRVNPHRLVYVNPAMSELTGPTNEELLSSTQKEACSWIYEQDRDAPVFNIFRTACTASQGLILSNSARSGKMEQSCGLPFFPVGQVRGKIVHSGPTDGYHGTKTHGGASR